MGPVGFARPRLSPDGDRVAATRMDEIVGGRVTVIVDGAHPDGQRLTFDSTPSPFPVWSPDGRRIAFGSSRGGPFDLYVKTVGGPAPDEAVMQRKSNHERVPTDWSRDGRWIVFQTPQSKTGWDVWAVSLAGERTAMPLVQDAGNQAQGRLSPDGRWLAYASDESGKFEVYVQEFPPAGGKWQISVDGGNDPVWRGDGGELFYLRADGGLMALPVKTSETFEPLMPQLLFRLRVPPSNMAPFFSAYDVTPDGQRFLVTTLPEEADRGEIVVAVNWQRH